MVTLIPVLFCNKPCRTLHQMGGVPYRESCIDKTFVFFSNQPYVSAWYMGGVLAKVTLLHV